MVGDDNISLEDLSKVVEAIYDCALDPNRWRGTVKLIAEFCQSQWCNIGSTDYANGYNELMFYLGYDDDFWSLHESVFKGMNPYLAPLQLQPVGAVVTSAMLIDDREFFESRFYQDLCKPRGICDSMGFKALQTRQRIALLSVNRLEPNPRYSDADVHRLNLLSPHVCRAVAISDLLNLKTVRSGALEATLDALTAGVYLTDRHGRVGYMNRAGERHVRTNNALFLERDQIVPVDRTARAAMSKALAEAVNDEAASPAGGVTLALPDGENGGLVAAILPLDRGERQNISAVFAAEAAIFVQDPVVVPPFPGEAFAKLYGLTGGELRVLLAMAPGLGVKEAADVLGISEATAKTHLQRIFAKTGTSKQTELLQLFMRSSPPVREG
jgi:DNA-binding CsgD family transcriptional regulator